MKLTQTVLTLGFGRATVPAGLPAAASLSVSDGFGLSGASVPIRRSPADSPILSLLAAGSALFALIRRWRLPRSGITAAVMMLCLAGQGFGQSSVIGGSWGQTVRVVVAADASSSCSALVRLIGEDRLPAAEKSFDLRPGQSGFVDVNLNRLTERLRKRVELLPAIQLRSGRCTAAAEVIENFTGRTLAYLPGLLLPASGRIPAPIGVAVSQFVRLGAARGFDPQPDPPKCAATLAFADGNGNPVGSPKTIDLAAGSFEVVDLDPGLLLPAAGDPLARRYVQPRLLLPASGGGDTRGCAFSVQVFDRITGWTSVAYAP